MALNPLTAARVAKMRIELMSGLLTMHIVEEDNTFRWYIQAGKPMAGAVAYPKEEKAREIALLLFRERIARDPLTGEDHNPDATALLDAIRHVGQDQIADETIMRAAIRTIYILMQRLQVQGGNQARPGQVY